MNIIDGLYFDSYTIYNKAEPFKESYNNISEIPKKKLVIL